MFLRAAATLATLVSTIAVAEAACPAGSTIADHVPGGALCLVAATYGAESAGAAPSLIVSLHGDGSAGGATDYMFKFAGRLAQPGIVSVALLRPGYYDASGRTSEGGNTERSDSYTPENVDAVAAAIKALKEHYKARRVIVVGHSGGAAITGVLIGKAPGLIQGAVLVSCPCDIPRWRTERGRRPWTRSESPSSYAGSVPTSTSVIAITGSSDDNTSPTLAEDYVAALAKRGVSASFQQASGGHNFRTSSAAAAQAALSLAER